MAVLNWREVTDEEYGVIGNPIAHSWSPRLFKAAFEAAGLPYRYVAIHCDDEEFEEAIAFLSTRMQGLNVTAPFKMRVEESLGQNFLQPCNVIYFPTLTADNTDCRGLALALGRLGLGGRTLVLGAGGAARSAIQGVSPMPVFNWNRKGVVFDDAPPVPPCTGGFHLVINATGSVPDLIWEGTGVAMDLSYGFVPTPFMHTARQNGWSAVDGREMLLFQAGLSYAFWLSTCPPFDVMREALP
ncbi:MAG: hypothetical protein JNK63_10730 [Chthonomonas sp.]|nr:hypothetical protein [Chthonomonas sp.]